MAEANHDRNRITPLSHTTLNHHGYIRLHRMHSRCMQIDLIMSNLETKMFKKFLTPRFLIDKIPYID